MIYFSIAFLTEAKPFIEILDLRLTEQAPFHIYSNQTTKLIITGLGRDKALLATTYLLTTFKPTSEDLLINFGLAGATHEFDIGELVLAHTIFDPLNNRYFYPDMRLQHPYKEVHLTTVNKVQLTPNSIIQAVDMEAFGVYQAALLFLKSYQILTFKLISDHFSATILNKSLIIKWITPHIQNIIKLLQIYQKNFPKELKFSLTLQTEISKIVKALRLTNSQINQLNDYIKGYILKYNKEPILPKHFQKPSLHKKDQKSVFNRLINFLSP